MEGQLVPVIAELLVWVSQTTLAAMLSVTVELLVRGLDIWNCIEILSLHETRCIKTIELNNSIKTIACQTIVFQSLYQKQLHISHCIKDKPFDFATNPVHPIALRNAACCLNIEFL